MVVDLSNGQVFIPARTAISVRTLAQFGRHCGLQLPSPPPRVVSRPPCRSPCLNSWNLMTISCLESLQPSQSSIGLRSSDTSASRQQPMPFGGRLRPVQRAKPVSYLYPVRPYTFISLLLLVKLAHGGSVGNPGLLDWYTPFLAALYEKSQGRLNILAHALVGHTPNLQSCHENISATTLSAQVEHLLEVVDAVKDRYDHVVLAGHSVGSWIALQVNMAYDVRVRLLIVQ